MNKHLVSINELPPDGKEFEIDDQSVWEEPISEFKMDYNILEPLKGKFFVQPADEGVLVRGKITGKAAIPCNRCLDQAIVDVNADFSEYEEIPPETKDIDQHGLIVYQMHSPMLNLDAVAWEQFQLALPVQPLCKEDCKGLCPECGINLNNEQCKCENNTGDPRMAALRGVTVVKK